MRRQAWASRSALLLLFAFVLSAAALAQHPVPRARRLLPPGEGLRHLNRLPEGQRELELRQNPEFQSLPPEKQHAVIHGLRHLNALPPAKQHKAVAGLRAFGKLSPRQRQGLRQVYTQFQAMTPAGRAAFRQAYNALRPLTPAARAPRLTGPALRHTLTPGQIVTLRQVLALDLPANLVGAGPRKP